MKAELTTSSTTCSGSAVESTIIAFKPPVSAIKGTIIPSREAIARLIVKAVRRRAGHGHAGERRIAMRLPNIRLLAPKWRSPQAVPLVRAMSAEDRMAHPALAGVAMTGSTATALTINRAMASRDGMIVPLIAETAA